MLKKKTLIALLLILSMALAFMPAIPVHAATPAYCLSGLWNYPNVITFPSDDLYCENISFLCGGQQFDSITIGSNRIVYSNDSFSVIVYSGGEWLTGYGTINFGNDFWDVPEDFYNWFIAHYYPVRARIEGTWTLDDVLPVGVCNVSFDSVFEFTTTITIPAIPEYGFDGYSGVHTIQCSQLYQDRDGSISYKMESASPALPDVLTQLGFTFPMTKYVYHGNGDYWATDIYGEGVKTLTFDGGGPSPLLNFLNANGIKLFDSDDVTVSGRWVFGEITEELPVRCYVNFSIGDGFLYYYISSYVPDPNTCQLSRYTSSTALSTSVVYSFVPGSYIDFGDTPQAVPSEFKEWLMAYATPDVEPDPEPEPTQLYISVKDSSENVLMYGYGLGPVTVKVMDGGIAVYFTEGDGSFAYAYTGVGEFGGVRVGSSTGSLYEPGEEFELTDGKPLYVVSVMPSNGYQIYDYGADELLGHMSHSTACIVYATAAGIEIREYATGLILYSYTWSGSDAFVGFSLSPLSYVQYQVGSYYISIVNNVKLYLYGEDDVGDGSGSGADVVDPTDPVDPDPTSPTIDLIDKEKEEAGNSGNSALDDLTQAVPDYSGQFIVALDTFVKSFSYEGTSCVLMIPAITMPGIDGLIPETEIMPVTSVDLEQGFNLFPEAIVLLVRSLLTIALIIYCFKELYDTISYFLTLKKGDG